MLFRSPPGKGAGANQTIAADGVLELTDMVGADGKVVNIAEAKAAAPVAPEPPAKEEPSIMADPVPEPAAKPKTEVSPDDVELSAPVEEPRVSAPPSDFDETLVSSGTAAVSTAAFAALARELDRKGGGEPLPTSVPVGTRLPPPESLPEARGFW